MRVLSRIATRTRLLGLAVFVLVDASLVMAGSLPSPPISLSVQSALVAEFIIPQPENGETLQSVNALLFYPGQLSIPEAGTVLQARLFDGHTMLGVHRRTFGRGSFGGALFRFTTPDSAAAGDAAIIDFAPIRTRMLHGRIEFSLLSGEADLLTTDETSLSLVRALDPQGGTTFSPSIQMEVFYVPEPSALVLASFAALTAVRRNRPFRLTPVWPLNVKGA